MSIVCLLIFVLFHGVYSSSIFNPKDYCNLRGNASQVCELCTFSTCAREWDLCGMRPMTKGVRTVIVDFHNNVRSYIAQGNAGLTKPASLMKRISYNMELEYVAQCYLNQCRFNTTEVCLESCSKQYPNMGTKHVMRTSSQVFHYYREEDFIRIYFNEFLEGITKLKLKNQNGTVFCEIKEEAASSFEHVALLACQLMKGNVEAIGCGLANNADSTIYQLTCLYSENAHLHDPLYQVGKLCSKCPKNVPCENGLCGKRNPIPDVSVADVYAQMGIP